jgi:hypothetical protein
MLGTVHERHARLDHAKADHLQALSPISQMRSSSMTAQRFVLLP